MPKFISIPNFDSLSPQTTKGDLISRSTTAAVRVAVGADNTVLTADSAQASGVKWAATTFTNPMTTGGDTIYGGASGTGTRLPNGSSGQFLQSAGGTSPPIWAFPGFNYTAQSTTYSAAINDYVLASSAAFTITLPTAVGNSGKLIGIQHGGSNFVVYTLATTSGQTIGGIASGSYSLYTNGETLVLVSDGANWQILNHKADTQWENYPSGPIIVGAGTPTGVAFEWRRSGPQCFWRGSFTTGTPTSTPAQLPLPGSVTISSTVGTNTITGNWTSSSGVYFGVILASPNNAYVSWMISSTVIAIAPQNGNTAWAGGAYVTTWGNIQITGWQP